MKVSWLRKFVGAAFVLVALAGAASLVGQVIQGLEGKVFDEKGNPLVGHPVVIERQDMKAEYRTKTNKKGEYIYMGLPLGIYKVILKNPSGQTLYFIGGIRVKYSEMKELNFDLAKEKALREEEEKKRIAASPELQQQIERRETEQKQMTSLKQVFEQGEALYGAKRYLEAAATFEQGIPMAKDKNLGIVLSRAGDSYRAVRKFDKALEYYQKAVSLAPQEATWHNNLGILYADMGKVPEAMAEYNKAAELDPSRASRYYFNLGAVMYNTGKIDEAGAAFKKATEADSTYAEAFYMLGQSLMAKLNLDPKTGQVAAVPGTAEALETYLKLEPEGKHVAEVQTMLQTIRGKVQTEYKAEKKKKN